MTPASFWLAGAPYRPRPALTGVDAHEGRHGLLLRTLDRLGIGFDS